MGEGLKVRCSVIQCASDFRGFAKNFPTRMRDVTKRTLKPLGVRRVVGYVTDKDFDYLLGKSSGERAIDFGVALSRIADENKFAVGKAFHQWLDHGRFVLFGILEEPPKTFVFEAELLQIERAGRKPV